jgi:sulfur-oxidizing protein SoxB
MNRDLMRRDFLKSLLAAGAVPRPAAAAADSTQGKTHKLTILQINDTHAYLEPHQECFPAPGGLVYRQAGGFSRIAALARAIRQETEGRVLFCDSGDAFFGTYPAQKSRGEVMVPVLNALGLAAMTAHWEFAYGPRRFRELASRLNYPVLAINVYDKKTGRLAFAPSLVKEVAGLKIGLIGIASNIVDKTMPPSFSEGLRFTLGREELPEIIGELRKRQNVDLVVLISHLGFPQDMKLLGEVPGVDVCLSGHTHNRLYQPALQGRTLVIQSGCHGSFLGRLDLDVQAGRIVSYRHQLIEVAANVRPDPEVEALVERGLAPYRKELAEGVGVTRTPLNRFTALEATADNCLLQAIREHSGAQMAFSNGWRFGASIVPGQVVLNDLFNLVPMNPPISTVELTGKELLAMIEENLERTFSEDAFQQMGGYVKRCLGITAHIKIENPAGLRIQKLYVGNEEVRPGEVYKAAFITEQGVPRKYGRNRQNLPDHAVEAMRTYLSRHDPVEAPLRGTFLAE